MPGRRQAWVQALLQELQPQPGLLPPIVHEDRTAAGAARATQAAIVAAHLQAPEAAVLLLEDDVEAHCEALSTIQQVSFPDTMGVISFCDMREVEEYAADGLYDRSALGSDGRGWWGNQALLIHPETVLALVNADWFSPEIESAPGVVVHRATYDDDGRNCADIRLALIVHHQPRRNRYGVMVPSVFLHLGHQSLCFPGRSMGERATRNWIGSRRRYGIH